MKYRAIYKCRLCGGIFAYGEAGEMVANAVAVELCVNERVRGITRKMCHICNDGSFGMADFQGFKEVEE